MGGENREDRGNRSHPIKMGNHLRVFSRRGQDLIHVLKDYSVAMVNGLQRVKLGIEGAPLAVSVMVRTRNTRRSGCVGVRALALQAACSQANQSRSLAFPPPRSLVLP